MFKFQFRTQPIDRMLLWGFEPQSRVTTDIPFQVSERVKFSRNMDISRCTARRPLSCRERGEDIPAYPQHLSQSTMG